VIGLRKALAGSHSWQAEFAEAMADHKITLEEVLEEVQKRKRYLS
jgi:hypothetical protein